MRGEWSLMEMLKLCLVWTQSYDEAIGRTNCQLFFLLGVQDNLQWLSYIYTLYDVYRVGYYVNYMYVYICQNKLQVQQYLFVVGFVAYM